MKLPTHTALLSGMLAVMAATSANAAFSFTNGDIILGVQAISGDGATKNVFFNLGQTTAFRDNGTTLGNLGNISTSLTSAFGANWYSRDTVYFGVFGNLNQQPTTGIGSRTPVDGDPSRTVYSSTPTNIVGAGQLVAAGTYGSSALGAGAGNFSGLESILPGLTTQSDGAAILVQGDSPVEWNNSWTQWNPTPGAAFQVFTGGIQQNFGKAGGTTLVDIQRIVATNTGASPTGIVGGGQYVGSIGISSDGNISAIPEPSSALLVLGAAAIAFRRRRNFSTR